MHFPQAVSPQLAMVFLQTQSFELRLFILIIIIKTCCSTGCNARQAEGTVPDPEEKQNEKKMTWVWDKKCFSLTDNIKLDFQRLVKDYQIYISNSSKTFLKVLYSSKILTLFLLRKRTRVYIIKLSSEKENTRQK